MLKYALPLILVSVLSSCAKDAANEINATAAAAGKSGDASAQTKAVLLADGCPNLNGNYVRRDSESSSTSIEFTSKQENGKTLYGQQEGKPFIPADGSDHEIMEDGSRATMSLSCSNGSLILKAKASNGATATSKYTLLSETELKLEADGFMTDMSGTYIKE